MPIDSTSYMLNGVPEGVNISVKDNATGQLKATGKSSIYLCRQPIGESSGWRRRRNSRIQRQWFHCSINCGKKDPEANYVNYVLNFTTDANQRITKVTDSKGMEATIMRDAQGNILETITKDTRTNQEVFRVVLTGYDNKKGDV